MAQSFRIYWAYQTTIAHQTSEPLYARFTCFRLFSTADVVHKGCHAKGMCHLVKLDYVEKPAFLRCLQASLRYLYSLLDLFVNPLISWFKIYERLAYLEW